MDSIWIKIIWGALIVMMLVGMYPAAKHWLNNGPRGSKQEWMGMLLPLAALIGFVVLLVLIVR